MKKPLKTQFEIASNRKSFSYRSIDDTQNRRRPQTKTSHELYMLPAAKRDRASATARDDRRNMSILAWMIRRHLDNVSRFTPYIHTGDDALDAVILKLLRWHAHRTRFDALGRHGRDEWMRMFEACKVINGDAAGLKSKGGKLQGIEGDRITLPLGSSGKVDISNVTEDGIEFNDDHTRKAFCVCRRAGTRGETLEFERLVPANEMIFDGYWPERFDADRGVSPLMTALNEGADVRETWEWLVLKAKASALFGLAFTRKSSDEIVPTYGGDPNTEAPADATTGYSQQIAGAIKSRGIINLDLDDGDDVKEIESATPNGTVIEFTRELIRSVLLSLDIPFTFYDSLTASFSARIADRNEYEESCEWKRDKNIGVIDEVYGWLFPIWETADLFGFSKALKKTGKSSEECLTDLQWSPAGRPWLDRAGEMAGHILALSAGITSVPRICAAYGDNAYAIAAEQKAYLDKCGIPILYAQGGQVPVNDLLAQAMQPKDAPGAAKGKQ